MSFKKYIRDNLLIICLLMFAIVTIEIFLMAYQVDLFIKVYIIISVTLSFFIGLSWKYLVKKSYYKKLQNTLDELDQKYLVAEIIEDSDFIEGKILKDILIQVDKSMIENVNKYKFLQEDYKEYIELWIHEIKTPIASAKLVIENNKNLVTKSIDEELDKIENYVEQALFYARSNTVEKDYYIKKWKLKEIVNESIKRNKSVLIQQKFIINLHDLDLTVNTDSKWIIFILNQLIQNSIKYKNKDVESSIEIYGENGKENIVLYVKDNGIGIQKGELNKVFEKGFTGSNGRMTGKKSTGIGLYLCKKLCEKLGIGIKIDSTYGKNFIVKIIFPRGSYINFD